MEYAYSILERFQQRHAAMQREAEEHEYRKMSHNMVPHLFRNNHISLEEYKKWALDPTGKYLPKLKKWK